VVRLVPFARRQWAEALLAEAGQVPPGRARLRWVAGGLWLVAREALVVRTVVYWLGAAVVAAGAAWVVWLSWRTSPADDPQAVTDRIRVLVMVAALVALPWAGRRRGWFGPAGGGLAARLVRVAGCAAVCGLGVALVRADRHLSQLAPQPRPFNSLREGLALALIGAALAALAGIRARWPDADRIVPWLVAVVAGLLVFFAVPLQALAISYLAAIFAATSRRSPVTSASLAAGTAAGLAAGLAVTLVVEVLPSNSDPYDSQLFYGTLLMVFLAGAIAGATAGRLLPGTGEPEEARIARGRQGALAGAVAGAAFGLLLANIFEIGVAMLVIGPLVATLGGTVGGLVAAGRLARSRPAGSHAAGLPG
jgi:hypothetical protein